MIAKDCININEREDIAIEGYDLTYKYWCCSYYDKKTTNCGNDCPKYDNVNAKDNIAKHFKGEK